MDDKLKELLAKARAENKSQSMHLAIQPSLLRAIDYYLAAYGPLNSLRPEWIRYVLIRAIESGW